MALLVTLAAWIVYYTTACRTVWIGDSGEFALALYSLGICHPPGYPLFTLLGGSFLAIFDFGRPILTAGFFNITVAALGITALFLILRRKLDPLTSTGLALLFAFSPLVWAETVGIEIYTLNVLLIGAAYLAIESEHPRRWPLMVYLFGLALTNHPSALSLGAALIVLYISERRYRNVRMLPVHVLLLALAASVYLYMLVRSPHNPATNWGAPTTIAALWDHMTLQQYSGWVENSWANLWHAAELYIRSLTKSFTILGIPLLLSGIVLGLRTARTRTTCASLILVVSLVLAAFHQARNYEPFYLPAMLFSTILIANNIIWLYRRFPSRSLKLSIGALLSLLAIGQAWSHYRDIDRSDYTMYESYCRAILDTADDGILFTAGDINSFGTVYLRYAEDYRPDLTVYDRSMRRSRIFDQVRQLSGLDIDDYHSARDIIIRLDAGEKYLAKNHYQNEPNWLNTELPYYSYGLLYRMQTPPADEPILIDFPPDLDGGDLMSRQMLAHVDLCAGEEALTAAPPDSSTALAAFRRAVNRMDNEPRAEMLYHLGVFFRRIGYGDLAIETYEEALTRPIMTPQERRNIILGISNVCKDRGNAALAANDYENAVSHYRCASELDPDNAPLVLNLALLHLQQLNDPASAQAYLEQYLQLRPEDQQARRLLNDIR